MINWANAARNLTVLFGLATSANCWAQGTGVPQETVNSSNVDVLVDGVSFEGQPTTEVAPGESELIRQTSFTAGILPPAPESLEMRVKKLEGLLSDMEQAEAKKKADAQKKPTFKIGGRVHLDSWSFTNSSPGIGYFENPATGADPEDRLEFRRLRLETSGAAFDNMVYRLQVDFADPNDTTIKDAYIGFTELPLLGTVLFGNQKRPMGLDHLNSSRYNIFIERPTVIEAFNEDARRLGIAAYNYSEDEVYNWRYGVYALDEDAADGSSIGDSKQLSFNARLASSPWYDESSGGRGYFHWAISGMVARPDGDAFAADTNSNDARFRTRAEIRSASRWLNTGRIAGATWYETMGLESIINVGPLQVVGEYQMNWTQRDTTTANTGPDLFFHGAYIQAAYMLTGEHVPLDRKSGTIGRVKPFENFFIVKTDDGGTGNGWGAFQVALRYSHLDLSDQDIQGGVENNLTGAFVWYFNAYSSLQFNAIYGDIDSHRPVGGYTGGHFTAIATRFRIDF